MTTQKSYRWTDEDRDNINRIRKELIGTKYQSEIGTLRYCIEQALKKVKS